MVAQRVVAAVVVDLLNRLCIVGRRLAFAITVRIKVIGTRWFQ